MWRVVLPEIFRKWSPGSPLIVRKKAKLIFLDKKSKTDAREHPFCSPSRPGQAYIHSQMQVPKSIDGGSAMEASTSVQNNLRQQPSVAEPSTFCRSYPFHGPGYERF
jgi:hypothetical protein